MHFKQSTHSLANDLVASSKPQSFTITVHNCHRSLMFFFFASETQIIQNMMNTIPYFPNANSYLGAQTSIFIIICTVTVQCTTISACTTYHIALNIQDFHFLKTRKLRKSIDVGRHHINALATSCEPVSICKKKQINVCL